MPSSAVLFDLDGTLTDPKLGITRCIQYALSELGYKLPNADELHWCIGLKRRDFLLLCGVSLVGGIIGSVALLYTSPDVFKKLISYLLLLATLVFTFGEPFKKWLQRQNQKSSPESVPLFNLVLAQLAIAIYGGFFGAGLGILMLATLLRVRLHVTN